MRTLDAYTEMSPQWQILVRIARKMGFFAGVVRDAYKNTGLDCVPFVRCTSVRSQEGEPETIKRGSIISVVKIGPALFLFGHLTYIYAELK